MSDGFKVIALGCCDKSDHMYRLGKTPWKKNGFVAMVANVDDTNMLWHQHLGHTNYGSFLYMS